MSTQPPDGPSEDPLDEAFVRALLGEVGREPEPLPDDVAARLDDVLADLVAERTLPDLPDLPDLTATGAGTSAVVVPLDAARRRRRRFSALVAAAAVVVGGYAVTTSGVLSGAGSGDSGDAASGGVAMDENSGSGSAGAGPEVGAFALSSRSLRSDAQRLVASDTDRLDLLRDGTGRLYAAPEHGSTPQDLGNLPQADGSTAEGQADAPTTGSKTGGLPAPVRSPAPAGRCLDPLVPARFPRLAVTYDGSPATAVVRPARPGASGAGRVRVEVWDCEAPLRLASVVVPR